MSYYTLAVWVIRDGRRVREIVDPGLRMPYHWACEKAAELTRRYVADGRTYVAVNVNEIQEEAP